MNGDTEIMSETAFILDIKALSINECFQGRRFKTPSYRDYERAVWDILPDLDPSFLEERKFPLDLTIVFGLSNINADYDNGIKAIQDIIQKKYNFDDKWIFRAEIHKFLVNKGDEFIYLKIADYNTQYFDLLESLVGRATRGREYAKLPVQNSGSDGESTD